jgi:hypothetical protein
VLLAIGAWTFTTTDSYTLLSAAFGAMKPVKAVETPYREVGVLINAPGGQVQALASTASEEGYHLTFSLEQAPSAAEIQALRADAEQAVPLLPSSGLVGWLGTRGYLHRLISALGDGHHFFYASRGYSIAQYLFAHHAGGRPIAGAVRLTGDGQIGTLRAGEVIQLNVPNTESLLPMLIELRQALSAEGLHAVPVAELLRNAGTQA